jgi:phage shock protein C
MKSIKKIIRKKSNSVIAGVCSAIADFFEIKPKIVRIIYLFFTIITAFFPGVLFYLFLMFLIPMQNE